LDAVKRNIFWIALAVILLVTGLAYLVMVKPVSAEARGLDEQFKKFEEDFTKWAEKPEDNVFSRNTINKIAGYKSSLDAEIKAVEEELAAKQFDLAKAGFRPAPPENPVELREWLKARYAARDAAAAKWGLQILCEKPAGRGDYPVETTPIGDDERTIALKRYYITREVYKALGKCSVAEKGRERDPDDQEKERDVSAERRVDGLKKLVFRTPKDMASARGVVRTGYGSVGNTLPDEPEKVKGKYYKEHLFELEVLCHFSLVQQVVRELDGIEDFMLVVKRADVVHTPPPRSGTIPAKGAEAFNNSRKREAPVTLVLECAVLELDL